MRPTSARVDGTRQALDAAGSLAEFFRLRNGTKPATMEQVRGQMRMLVDRLLSESGIYAPEWATLALKQSEGNLYQAACCLRSEAATLERRYRSDILDTAHMFVERRISSSFREIPGGQILGATRDYTQRLLDESLARETSETARAMAAALEQDLKGATSCQHARGFSRVTNLLRTDGLMKSPEMEAGDYRPRDPRCEPLSFPHHRSASLSALASGETGIVMALGYASQRGFGGGHGTIGELRVGRVTVHVTDARNRRRCIGQLRVTECEMVGRVSTKDVGGAPSYSVGYGLCFGQNETKAICMGKLESSLREPKDHIPASSPEYVLPHLDGCASTGALCSLASPGEAEASAEHILRARRALATSGTV